MRGPLQGTIPDDARDEALQLLADLTAQQLEARWNLGPTTGAVLRAVAADPGRVRCATGYVSVDEKHPATSTVYVRPPRPFRISPGPSQCAPWDDDNASVHPNWCECAGLLRYTREVLGLDHDGAPNEIHAEPPESCGLYATSQEGPAGWVRLWWD